MRMVGTFLIFTEMLPALIKYFTNNQYNVTDLIIQRINIDFKYVVLPMWEKPGVRSPPLCPAAILIFFNIYFNF